MADTVRYHLEEMVPELEDLEKRGYFNKGEIRQIVKKRTDFEYALKRRAPIKADYLRYIEYEQKLDQLRKHRRRILGLEGQKRTLADYGFVRRIHFIYERATRKFRGDLGLWMAWAEFCKGTRSSKQMSRVLTKALQLHPAEAGLWAYAAAWEFELNGNPTAARTLMQRGIRMNKENQALWVEYFKFELLYAHRLRARRSVLGIEERAAEEGEGDESEAAVQQVLDGVIALVVFRNACKAIPDSVSFRRLFLDTLADFDLPGVPAITAEIYDSLARDFPTHDEAWDLRARRHVPADAPAGGREGGALVDGEENAPSTSTSRPDYPAALKAYNEALKAVAPAALPQMGERFVAFLVEQLRRLEARGAEVMGSKKAARAAAAALGQALAGVARSLAQSGACSEGVWTTWAEHEVESGRGEAAIKVLREATAALPSSAALWQRRVELEVAAPAATEPSLLALFQQCLDRAPLPEGARAWPRMLAALPEKAGNEMSDDSDSDQDGAGAAALFPSLLAKVEARFLAAGPQPVRGAVSEAMADVVDIVGARRGEGAARALGGRILACMAAPGLEVLQALGKLEFAALEGRRSEGARALDLRPARKVLEHAVAAYGQVEPVVWLTLAGLEREFGAGDVSGVVWRARKTLQPAALDAFEEALRASASS